MTDINRELAEDAAEDYSDDPVVQYCFQQGWLDFCSGVKPLTIDPDYQAGYIAARDAPE